MGKINAYSFSPKRKLATTMRFTSPDTGEALQKVDLRKLTYTESANTQDLAEEIYIKHFVPIEDRDSDQQAYGVGYEEIAPVGEIPVVLTKRLCQVVIAVELAQVEIGENRYSFVDLASMMMIDVFSEEILKAFPLIQPERLTVPKAPRSSPESPTP
jgi:hypothetical protein